MEARGCQVSFLSWSLPLFLEQALSKPEAHWSAGLAGQWISGIHLFVPQPPFLPFLTSPGWDHRNVPLSPAFHMVSEYLNSGPCACLLINEAIFPALGNAFYRARIPHYSPVHPTPVDPWNSPLKEELWQQWTYDMSVLRGSASHPWNIPGVLFPVNHWLTMTVSPSCHSWLVSSVGEKHCFFPHP